MSELVSNGVQIYQFPTDDETVSDINTSMNSHVPFAVVGSTDFIRVGNKMQRARQYPWGTVSGKYFTTHFLQCNIAYPLHPVEQQLCLHIFME